MKTDRRIAFWAMVASVAAVFVSVSSDYTQRKHMKLSVKPIPAVLFTQTTDDLFVELQNVGTGPMILVSVSYTYKDSTVAQTIIDPNSFSKGTAGEIVLFELDAESAVAAGRSRRLLNYDPDPEILATQIRAQALRTVLDETVVQVTYTDVYGTTFPQFRYSLKARNIIPQ